MFLALTGWGLAGGSVSTLDPSVHSSEMSGFLHSRVLLEFWPLGILDSRLCEFYGSSILKMSVFLNS